MKRIWFCLTGSDLLSWALKLIVEKAIEKQMYKGFIGEHSTVGGYKAKLSSWVHAFSAKGQMGFVMLLSLPSGYVSLCFACILIILSNLHIFLWLLLTI